MYAHVPALFDVNPNFGAHASQNRDFDIIVISSLLLVGQIGLCLDVFARMKNKNHSCGSVAK